SMKNILNPVLSVAGISNKVQAADDFNPYYDVTQWGYSPDELYKLRNDPSYSYYQNLENISQEKIDELSEKYGKCFDVSKTNYEVEKMSECSKDRLRGSDDIFRYRLTLLDEETLSLLEQKPEDIGKDPVDDGGRAIINAGTAIPPSGGGSVGIEQTSEIPGTNKRINTEILPQFLQMLDAAKADKIDLMPISSAWRDPAKQIELRKAHCADWQNTPSGDCNPPTAKPGTSKHESGRAIDFSNMCFSRNGSSSCKGNARWEWLKANAATYGFYPLKSEAWHWSTTGS
ncbi:M15 family metallopeptidase, partial [Candidatus Saccharibacteria bacterium]|nr:M15 family metallopeptidase [Candidatus Saccharibacteria bacterium]